LLKTYETTGVVTINAGYIGLTEEQAAPRAKNLEKRKKLFEIISPVQFKAGEIIRLEKPDKILLSQMVEVGKANDVG